MQLYFYYSYRREFCYSYEGNFVGGILNEKLVFLLLTTRMGILGNLYCEKGIFRCNISLLPSSTQPLTQALARTPQEFFDGNTMFCPAAWEYDFLGKICPSAWENLKMFFRLPLLER